MRMHADTAPDIGKFLRHRPHAGKARQLGADGEAGADPGRAGARHHARPRRRQIGKVQMAMAVDQHLSVTAVRRPSRRRGHVARRAEDGLPRLQMRPLARAKLSSRRASNATQRSRSGAGCAGPGANAHPPAPRSKKSPNRASPSCMRQSLSPSARSARISGLAALSISRSASCGQCRRPRRSPMPARRRWRRRESRASAARPPAFASGR